MARGFTDSSGKFRPTGNNGTSSREKSTNPSIVPMDELFETHQKKQGVEKDIDFSIFKLRDSVTFITDGAKDLFVMTDSRGHLLEKALDELNTFVVLTDDPNDLNDNQKESLIISSEKITELMSLLADNVGGLTRHTDRYIFQDHGRDMEKATDEIVESLEKSVGFTEKFAEPMSQLMDGWGKIYESKYNLENEMEALQSLVFHMVSGKVTRKEIKIDVQHKIRDIRDELVRVKTGIEEMKTGRVRLVSALKIEFNLPIETRST